MGHQFTIDVEGAECVLAVDESGLTVGRGTAVLHRLPWSDLREVAEPTSLSARLTFAGRDPLTLRFDAREDRDAFRPWAQRRGAVDPPPVAVDTFAARRADHPAVVPATYTWPPHHPPAALPAGVTRMPHRAVAAPVTPSIPSTPAVPMHTLPSVPGQKLVESLGMVTAQSLLGLVARADASTHPKGAVGGTITVMEKAVADGIRAAALDLSATARALGADAVVAVTVTTACVADRVEAIILVGTAVRTGPVTSGS